MLRNISQFAVAIAILSLPTSIWAGGPPLLCLPVDGVTSKKLNEWTEILNAKLADVVLERSIPPQGVKVVRHADQWYLTFDMGQDVRLSDVKSALAESVFSIPGDS